MKAIAPIFFCAICAGAWVVHSAPEPTYEWDAARDTPGDNVWTNTTGSARSWTFTQGTPSPRDVADARFTALTKA